MLEYVLQDGRSSNTWPQQLHQPWSQSHLGAELVGSHDQSAYHRPISMQMSDPLSRRNIWQNSGLYMYLMYSVSSLLCHIQFTGKNST